MPRCLQGLATRCSRCWLSDSVQVKISTMRCQYIEKYSFLISIRLLVYSQYFPVAQHGRKRAPPIADLSPIKASPTPSPVHSPPNLLLNTLTRTSASTKAKENISNFNKLAASVVAASPNAKRRFLFQHILAPHHLGNRWSLEMTRLGCRYVCNGAFM